MSDEYEMMKKQKIRMMKKSFLKDNKDLVDLLQKIESELYHICKFNVSIQSKTLIPLCDYMREKGIEKKD